MNQVVSNPKQHITFLRDAMEECVNRGLLDEIDPPVDHYLADGLYGRRVYVPAGVTIVTKVHLTQHITVALKGTCTVFGENGARNIVTAPAVFITEPGTCRAIYCHDEVEWLTVHHCELTDIPAIEHHVFCDNFKEYDDRTDYKRVLLEYGLDESMARMLSENFEDQTDNDCGFSTVYLDDSALQGIGVFALHDLTANDVIGIARINDLRTKIGRYTNHSANPNCRFEICDNSVKAIALKDIKKGTEITVDYRNAFAIANKLRLLT